MDAQIEGGKINFILTARNRFRSINLNCSDKKRKDIQSLVSVLTPW
jgi:hypothetical protein